VEDLEEGKEVIGGLKGSSELGILMIGVKPKADEDEENEGMATGRGGGEDETSCKFSSL
jgi:hypothetical protein